jgi:hypothetical protein
MYSSVTPAGKKIQEKMMTTNRRSGGAVLGSAIIALAFIAGGCGNIFETPEGACRRAMNHMEDCLIRLSGVGFGVPVSQLCRGATERTPGELSVAADCITSLSCSELTGEQTPDFAADCVAIFGLP